MKIITKLRVLLEQHGHLNLALLDQGVVSGVNFFSGILLVRFLGVNEFGVYALLWVIVQLISGVQFALISSPVMSIGPRQEFLNKDIYYSAAWVHQLFFSAVVTVLFWLGAISTSVFFTEWNVAYLANPLAATIFAVLLQDFVRRYLFSCSRNAEALLIDLIGYLGQLIALILIGVSDKLSVENTLWIVAIANALASAFGLLKTVKVLPNWLDVANVFSRHWHFAKWSLFQSLLYQISSFPVVWALGWFHGSAAVGIFVAAKNMLGFLNVIFLGMDNSIRPGASRAYADGAAVGAFAYIRRLYVGLAIPIILLCLVVAIFPRAISTLFYGNLLLGHEFVVSLFALSYLLAFVERPYYYLLLTAEQMRPLARADIIRTSLVFVSFVPLVMLLDLAGAMVLIVATNAIHLAVVYRQSSFVLTPARLDNK